MEHSGCLHSLRISERRTTGKVVKDLRNCKSLIDRYIKTVCKRCLVASLLGISKRASKRYLERRQASVGMQLIGGQDTGSGSALGRMCMERDRTGDSTVGM